MLFSRTRRERPTIEFCDGTGGEEEGAGSPGVGSDVAGLVSGGGAGAGTGGDAADTAVWLDGCGEALPGLSHAIVPGDAEESEVGGLGHAVEEHAGGGAFEVGVGFVEDGVPEARLWVLEGDDTGELLFEEFAEAAAAGGVGVGFVLEGFDGGHDDPAVAAGPEGGRVLGGLFVPHVVVEAGLGVLEVFGEDLELTDRLFLEFLAVGDSGEVAEDGAAHVEGVDPELRFAVEVAEAAVGGSLGLGHHEGVDLFGQFEVGLLAGGFVEHEHGEAGAPVSAVAAFGEGRADSGGVVVVGKGADEVEVALVAGQFPRPHHSGEEDAFAPVEGRWFGEVLEDEVGGLADECVWVRWRVVGVGVG